MAGSLIWCPVWPRSAGESKEQKQLLLGGSQRDPGAQGGPLGVMTQKGALRRVGPASCLCRTAAGSRCCSPGVSRVPAPGIQADLCSQATRLGRLDTCVPPGKLLKRLPRAFVGAGSGGRRRPAGQLEGLSLPHLTNSLLLPPVRKVSPETWGRPPRRPPSAGRPWPSSAPHTDPRAQSSEWLSALQRFEKAGGHLSLGLSAQAGRGWGPQDKGGAGPQIQPSPAHGP